MKKMGKKIGSAALCLSLIFALAGCSDGEVDYDLGTEMGGTEEGTKEESRGLGQYVDNGRWEDNFTVEGEYGKTQVYIVADISVPESESMSVVEVKEPEFDEAYKKKLTGTLFDDGELYACTKLPESEEEGKEILMRDILDEASFEPAEGYGADVYLGSRDGSEFVLRFQTHTAQLKCHESPYVERSRTIELAPKDPKEFCPEGLKGEEKVIYRETVWAEESAENACEMGEGAAQELAERALSDFNFSCYMLESKGPLWWFSYGGNNTQNEGVMDGWQFTYTLAVDGLPLTHQDDFYSNTFLKQPVEMEPEIYEDMVYAIVSVTDEGVIGVSILNPVEVTGQTKDVELLPLDSIKTLLVNELKDYKLNYDLHADDVVLRFTNLDLVYLRVMDDSGEGSYSYVPAWQLCTKDEDENGNTYYRRSLFLNAIDGSVLRGPELPDLQ